MVGSKLRLPIPKAWLPVARALGALPFEQYRDNGKENGFYYNIIGYIYWGYIGLISIMFFLVVEPSKIIFLM